MKTKLEPKIEKSVLNKKTEKKKLFKKKKKEQLKETKKVKLIVNLKKCSQNWAKVATSLPPKPVFKRQSLKKQPPEQVSKEAATTTTDKKIWFEVDKTFFKNPEEKETESEPELEVDSSGIKRLEPKSDKKLVTKALAVDCEMVGVGENGKDSILARISIVNQFNDCIYDKYVLPTETVTDYRTSVSGIRPSDLKKSNNAVSFSIVQKEVSELLESKILVGHAVHNDLKVLFLSHPKKKIRDTQKCKIFRQKYPSIGGLSSLKKLAQILLGITIQEGEHNSVHDAQAAMMLYTTYKKEWEAHLRDQRMKPKDDQKAVAAANQESVSVIRDGVFTKSNIEINSGNDNHKRYLQNKLKKRQRFTKKFIK